VREFPLGGNSCAGRFVTTFKKPSDCHSVMNTRLNHPRGVLFDLLNDMVARLDDLLVQLAAETDVFRRELRADSSQRSSSRFARHVFEMTTPTDTRPIDSAVQSAARRSDSQKTSHQLLLELHQMHARLAEIIRQLEEREGLGGEAPVGDGGGSLNPSRRTGI